MIGGARTPGGELSDYVQSGLVLHLDGKSGKSGSTWTSVVGSVSFTNNNATFNDDNISFNGSSSYLSNTSFTTPLDTVGTIEICFEKSGSGNGIMYMPATDKALALGIFNSKAVWTANASKKSVYSVSQNKGIISINNDLAIMNGVSMTSSGTDFWTGRITTTYIGRRGSGNIYYYSGKIYSIRIYERKLSQEEIIHNQKVDNVRFNLGLSI